MTSQPKPGEVLNGESVRLLLPGDQYLCSVWGVVTFDRFDDSGRRAFVTDQSGQVRLMVPAGQHFVERPLESSGGQDGGGEENELRVALTEVLSALSPLSVMGKPIAALDTRLSRAINDAVMLLDPPAILQAIASPAKVTGWPSREVEEALRGALEWDKARGYRMPYRVRDPIYAALDKLALFPRPEDEGAA